jgi:hypothetical protein
LLTRDFMARAIRRAMQRARTTSATRALARRCDVIAAARMRASHRPAVLAGSPSRRSRSARHRNAVIF